MKSNIKLGLITSKGGHMFELMQLNKFWEKYDRFWVTFRDKDTQYYLKKERVYFGYFPESRNFINFIKNFILSFRILSVEKPGFLLSCGAGIAIPFFIVGKIFFKVKLIYIESYDFITYPSLTGKIIYKFADVFIVQHKRQTIWFPKAKYLGSLL